MSPSGQQEGSLPGVPNRAESGRESFILRVWLEESPEKGKVPWRGRIIHLPSAAELHSCDLNRIRDFIAGHLDRMGARLSLSHRLTLWLAQRFSRSGLGRGIPR